MSKQKAKDRVLVVDDDEGIRTTFEFYLAREGYSVRTSASATAAFGVVAEFEPDVVITDVQMPEMSGLELLERLHNGRRSTDVIVITGYEGMETAVEAIRGGAYDYLVKPVDLDQLDAVLTRCFLDRAARAELMGMADVSELDSNTLVGTSRRMIEIYKLLGALAATTSPVVIRGETGTGKEMIARAIHTHSPAAAEPFIAINCTAVPEPLLESELFGHLKGSFTGAVVDRRGRFELAGAGTIFFDEIGDTSVAFQAKLLRVLQEQEYYPVGSERPKRTQARVIAATHRDLESLVAEGKFREDLYFRLKVIEVHIPPLRERREDIPRLAEHLLRKACRAVKKDVPSIKPEAMAAMQGYDWPGNVRELENAITRAVVLATGPAIAAEHLGLRTRGSATAAGSEADLALGTLEDAGRIHVERIIRTTGGNKRQAAKILGISRPRLDRLLERYGIDLSRVR